jgi:glycosyltransferase involved in cell wall biosynthesis
MQKFSKKIAILQNQIGLDGRSRVIIEIIGLLNEQSIIPDVITFSNSEKVQKFREGFNLNVEFNVRRIPLPYTIGCLHQMILLNMLSNSKIRQYDLVINSNDVLHFLPSSLSYIYFIHDPLESAFVNARQRGGPGWWNYYVRVLERICTISGPCLDHGTFLTNSNYTRQRLLEHYPLLMDRVKVIYPPAVHSLPSWKDMSQRQIDVVSLGTFSRHKNQLIQLELARSLPDLRFVIVGSVFSKSYFHTCEAFVNRHRLQNVILVPDAPFEKLEEILGSAKIFLHTKEDEGFGVATVQAIAAGCLPLVPDSGGSREVVLFPELRFRYHNEIAARLTGIIR